MIVCLWDNVEVLNFIAKTVKSGKVKFLETEMCIMIKMQDAMLELKGNMMKNMDIAEHTEAIISKMTFLMHLMAHIQN